MRLLLLLILTSLLSCNSGNVDNSSTDRPIDYQSALIKTQKQILESDSLIFIFRVNKMVTDKPVSTTVYNKAEIEKFAKLFIEDAKSDSCRTLGCGASFIVFQQGRKVDSINYCLSVNCPTFQFVKNKQEFTSKMSYRCGMFLYNFVQTENNKMFEKNK